MRQIKKIIGGMLCCVLITGLFSVPVDASKKKSCNNRYGNNRNGYDKAG